MVLNIFFRIRGFHIFSYIRNNQIYTLEQIRENQVITGVAISSKLSVLEKRTKDFLALGENVSHEFFDLLSNLEKRKSIALIHIGKKNNYFNKPLNTISFFVRNFLEKRGKKVISVLPSGQSVFSIFRGGMHSTNFKIIRKTEGNPLEAKNFFD